MEKPNKSLTETLLEDLKNGRGCFEITSPCNSQRMPLFATISSSFQSPNQKPSDSLFFARINPSQKTSRQPLKKVERYSVQKVRGDGRCLFRSLVKGMATNKGIAQSPREEEKDADELRMAVKEALCTNEKQRRTYEEALISITVEEPLKRYCQRINHSDFWGGEAELLVLSKLCKQTIIVYIPESEANGRRQLGGFIPIVEYGSEFKSSKGDGRKPVRLLYSGSNHYDLLI